MKTLQMIHYFNFVIATVFVVFYFYQIGYLLLGLFMKHRKGSTGPHKLCLLYTSHRRYPVYG